MVYLDDVISFGESISEALAHLEEVLCRLSDFGLQLKAKKCTFMQTEVAFLGHIVGTEALQSCLPHQLDIRTGQLWAEGRSMLVASTETNPSRSCLSDNLGGTASG